MLFAHQMPCYQAFLSVFGVFSNRPVSSLICVPLFEAVLPSVRSRRVVGVARFLELVKQAVI